MSSDVKTAIATAWSQPARASGYTQVMDQQLATPAQRQAWSETLAAALGPESRRILDVGTGPGFLALLLAEMGHTCTGIDISPEMIAIAQARAAERQLACQFHLRDAEQLAFADHSFEVVTNRIVLWLLPHPGRAIHDWCRVLTPGGKLLIGGSQPPPSHSWRWPHWLRMGQRLLGLRLRQPAYYRALRQPDYQQALAQLPFRTATPAQVMALMEAAGLQRVHLLSGERIQQADQAARAGNRGPWPQRYILVGTKQGD